MAKRLQTRFKNQLKAAALAYLTGDMSFLPQTRIIQNLMNQVKVKLMFKDIVILHKAHAAKDQPGTGPYYDLLREHAADFALFFGKLMDKGNNTYTVKFTSLQALAFTQLWLDQPLPPSGTYTILNVLKQLDQAHVNVKAILAATQLQS